MKILNWIQTKQFTRAKKAVKKEVKEEEATKEEE